MLKPRTAVASVVIIAALSIYTCLLISGACIDAPAQQAQEAASDDATQQAIKLYEQGDTKGAINALRAIVKLHKGDADAWYYLGLALNRDNDPKGARKALEQTVKLRPNYARARAALAYLLLVLNKSRDGLREAERALKLDAQNAEAYYVISVVRLREDNPPKALEAVEAALKYTPSFPAAFLLKSQALLGMYAHKTDYVPNESPEARSQRTEGGVNLLKEAADSLEKYLQLNSSSPKADIWREQLASLRVYQNVKQDNSSGERKIFLSSELTTKAKILSRPEPQYTEAARKAQVSGTVVIRAVFAADGTVQNLLVIRSLSDGLTEAAVRAARKIKFLPATKDGHPVSQFIQIEYNFNLY
jgi:TonB family protein